MVKETHGYRFVSKVSAPQELYEKLEDHLSKDFRQNDLGKNCVFRMHDMTIVLSLTRGKLTINTNLNKLLTQKRIEEMFDGLSKEVISNLRVNKKEIRDFNGRLKSKGHYADYHYFGDTPPSCSRKFQKKLDEIDIKLLHYAYYQHQISTDLHDRFRITYHTFKRKLDKLARFRLLGKVGKSPALYVTVNGDRGSLLKDLIDVWERLFYSENP